MPTKVARIDGVVIGVFLGFDGEAPLVVFPGNPKETALPAKRLVELTPEMMGAQVAILFEEGDPARPLILGRIVEPASKERRSEALPADLRVDPGAEKGSEGVVLCDGKPVSITAQERLELRCGKATIIMERDGHITIRGTYVVSHASAANRIRGGSVNLN